MMRSSVVIALINVSMQYICDLKEIFPCFVVIRILHADATDNA